MESVPSSSSDFAGPDYGPTALRIVLGSQLRRLRVAKGITPGEAGHAIRGSAAKISRLELGRTGFKSRDVTDLLTLYSAAPDERTALLELVSHANNPGWWHQYGDILSRWFEAYVGLEEAASIIRTYELQYVPGLLQTEDYARSVIRLLGSVDAKEVERRVNLRMRRQKRLLGPSALHLWAVVDEAVLRRQYGGAKVMRAQVDHLIQMAKLPNVTLQVVPFAQGGHSAAGGPFSLLRFPLPELPDVVYLEQMASALYLDKPEDTHSYMEVMDRLSLEASPPSATPALLKKLRDTICWAPERAADRIDLLHRPKGRGFSVCGWSSS